MYLGKYYAVFVVSLALTVITLLISLSFMYSQSNGQVNTRFNIYKNDIYKVKIQYPSNWEQVSSSLLPADSIARFIAPSTGGGVTKPTGVLITIFNRPDDRSLNEFIDFFHKNRYAQQSDFTIVNSSETTLAGIPAREIVLYEQRDNVLDPKSDLKVMRVYALDNNSHQGYVIRYYSEPGLFNKYLPVAQKMINSFKITDRPHVESFAALVNDTSVNSSDILENVTRSINSTIEKSPISINKMNIKPFAPSLVDGNNTINHAAVLIERGSSFPDNKKFYNPSNLTIQGNTTVMWTNNDTVLHTVTSGNPNMGPSKLFDSSLIEPNGRFNYTFSTEGVYKYYCTLHPFMTGMLTVTKQTRPIVTVIDQLPKKFDVSIAEGSSFPSNKIFFAPPEIRIAPNGTVVWTNADSIIHTVTSGKPRQGPSGEFDSGIIQSGDSFSHTFSKTGTYDYYSGLHPYMVGKVIVGLYSYNLQVNNRTYPISFLLTGDGNQLQKISLQKINPTLEIRMMSASAGNLTLVIPRILLDKVDTNGNDDAYGVIGNRAVGFNETSTTPTSRTLVMQFDPGVNYIQILGTKSIEPETNQVIVPPNDSKISPSIPKTNSKVDTPAAESESISNNISSDETTVSIEAGSSSPSNDKYFVPKTITIPKGTTVTWTNRDVTLHTVTSGSPESGNSGTEFDSSYLAAEKTFQNQFNSAGTFDYYCTLHPWMNGQVIVN